MNNGILPLDEHSITASSRKTSNFRNVDKEVLMSGEKPRGHSMSILKPMKHHLKRF